MNNYDLVIDILAEKIKEKDGEIFLLKYRIDDLEEKLKEAESHINKPSEKTAKLEIR